MTGPCSSAPDGAIDLDLIPEPPVRQDAAVGDSMAARGKDSRPHVIVVEDEAFQRETLVEYLDGNGYRASGVETGAALRKLVEKDPPALVLLDLRLPGGEDGFSLARYLRERSKRMGIIMVTASGDTVARIENPGKLGGTFFKTGAGAR